mmetsp:Transcript_38140/g.83790  ORF Transcript_38140/g.83790 Transcript_38140/m.83790 type:complete len:140 (+) Transcript_38140:287-706(+)
MWLCAVSPLARCWAFLAVAADRADAFCVAAAVMIFVVVFVAGSLGSRALSAGVLVARRGPGRAGRLGALDTRCCSTRTTGVSFDEACKKCAGRSWGRPGRGQSYLWLLFTGLVALLLTERRSSTCSEHSALWGLVEWRL